MYYGSIRILGMEEACQGEMEEGVHCHDRKTLDRIMRWSPGTYTETPCPLGRQGCLSTSPDQYMFIPADDRKKKKLALDELTFHHEIPPKVDLPSRVVLKSACWYLQHRKTQLRPVKP